MLTKASEIDFGDWKSVFVRQVAFIMFPLRRIGNNITKALLRPTAQRCVIKQISSGNIANKKNIYSKYLELILKI